MENLDKTTFSLDDNPNDEIVEEEVIDRDEEYDDDDYDEDEEYDDEEEYDDDGEYDDEDYDDGYNDDYYDDRLNKVLDEIAELKRGMASQTPAVQQPVAQYQPPMPPQYIYQPSAPPAGSEVVMYNEISRLRDELARNQSSLEMQKELTRIKEDMARDQRFSESQYAAEIKRLQDRIEELQKNASSPQSDPALAQAQEPARLEGGNGQAVQGQSLDFDKLLSINEAILRATRDSDARIQGEISAIKHQLENFPSAEDLSRAVSAVKKASATADGVSSDVLSKLAGDINSLRAAMGEKGAGVPAVGVPVIISSGGGSDVDASELLRQLYEIKNLLGSSSASTVKRTQVLLDLIAEYKKVCFDVRSASVSYKDKLASVYAYVKKLQDSNEPDALDLIEATNELIRDLAARKLDKQIFGEIVAYYSEKGPALSSAVRDSADKFFAACEKVAEASIDELSDYLPDLVSERNVIENNKHEDENNELLGEITNAMFEESRDDDAITEMVEKLTAVTIGDVVELQLIAAPKTYKPSHSVNDDSIFTKLAELKAAIVDSEAAKAKSDEQEEQAAEEDGEAAEDEWAQEVLAAIDELRETITAGNEAAAKDKNADNAVSSALEEIRGNYLDISERLVRVSEQLAEAPAGDAEVLTQEEKAKALDDLAYIRTKLDDYDLYVTQITDLRNDVLNISSALDFTEQYNSLVSELTSQFDKLYEDINGLLIETENNIVTRVGETSVTADVIDAAKADILADTQAVKDQVYTVADSVTLLSDNVQFVSDTVQVLLDGKADITTDTQAILADTQSIRDSLVLVNDAVVNSPINEAIEQMRADLSAFADLTAANVDASTADRQKLLDDVAYLRERAEQELAEKEQAALESTSGDSAEDPEQEKLNAYLDDIAAKVELLATVPEDVTAVKDDTSATKESVAALTDNINALLDVVSTLAGQEDIAVIRDNTAATLDAVTPIADSVAVISDNVAAINDNVVAMNDNVVAVSDAVTALSADVADTLGAVKPIAEDVVAARDAAAATLDALAPITDQLNAILDRLEPAEASENGTEVLDGEEVDDPVTESLEELKENLNTILDTLPLLPQADDLVTARDNTYSILDTLTMMPQADDITTIRDNVATALDAINALTDSVNSYLDTTQNAANVVDDIAALRADTDALLETLPETLAEDLAVVRDNTGAMLDSMSALAQSQEDIQYIRQKLDETGETATGDSLEAVMQDLTAVLDKLEAYEKTAADNKQEIIDTVSGIREEIHINELDETISAAGIDDQTRETLVGEISEIRERLANLESASQGLIDANATALDGINAQLADIQNALAGTAPEATDTTLAVLDEINEKLDALAAADPGIYDAIAADIADIKALVGGATVRTEDGETAPIALSDENLQAIIDELAVIKEKIDAESEYDTIGEILSLREDVKAARIVDQNEVSGELESIKNELAAISSGNLLDEIRAIRDDIAALGVSGDGATPTNEELNLVLNEIVSLRDEVFAFKDEVLNATAVAEAPVADETTDDANDDVTTILDEITALRADQTTLTGNIEELKDIISRRTTLAAEGEQDAVNAASNELNVVLDEIIDLKNDIGRIEAAQVPVDRLDALAAKVEELHTLIDGLAVPAEQAQNEELAEIRNTVDEIAANTSAVDLAALAEQVDNISKALSDLESGDRGAVGDGADGGEYQVTDGSIADSINELHAEIDELKSAVMDINLASSADDIAALRNELAELRAENEQLRQENADIVTNGFNELRDAIRDMALSMTPATTADGDTSYAALIDEIRGLKEQIATQAQAPVAAAFDEDTLQSIRDALATQSDAGIPLAEELGDIRDEIAQLRSLTQVTAESGSAAEVAAIRNEIAELREALSSPEHMSGLAEDVSAIKADVQTMREEPDLGVLNEILALRDEFQALREEIEDVKRIAGETDRESDDSILTEVQSLRDQLFAISMANVNDSESGETNYESYNNLILDEIASLRDQIDAAGSADDIRAVSEELESLRAALARREELYDELAERVQRLDSDATNDRILEELASLREELANQRDADLTTLNFMSEMAHLLERQNSYLSENSGSKISDEIESLKAELAAGDAMAEEIAKLRAVMTQNGSDGDNAAILRELAELREELSAGAPSRENDLILQEIARLRDELSELTDREARREGAAATDSATDSELEESLSDLKNQLNEIAGIVEPEKQEKPVKKTPAKRKTSGSGKKKSTGSGSGKKKSAAKRQSKAATETATVTERVPEIPLDDFDAKVNDEVSKLGGDEGDMYLDPDGPISSDTVDVADRLAKQVANKLVLEQLVEQLGDGGISDERIEEILKEILPQEFSTVALTEQSDKVRRLANQLVLKKLRERLEGKTHKDED